MNPIVKDMMDFIPKFVRNGGGRYFTIRYAFYAYTNQSAFTKPKLVKGNASIWLMRNALVKLREKGLVENVGMRKWKWIGD